MDKNKLIGLGLIGFILVAIGIINKKDVEKTRLETTPKTEQVVQKETKKEEVKTTTGKTSSSEKTSFKEETITLTTDKSIYEFSTKGGNLAAVYLKEYKSFKHFEKKEDKPLKLFGKGDNTNELVFKYNGNEYRTGNKPFEVIEQTANRLVLQNTVADGKYIQYVYTTKNGAYDLDFDINFKGFAGDVAPNSVMMNWTTDMSKTEQLLQNERMVATISYQDITKEHDYLSEGSDDYEADLDENINWVAFKKSYFSAIMKSSNTFAKEGTKFEIKNYSKGHKKEYSHIKHYKSLLNLGIANTADANIHINWFFGPNKLEILETYNSGYEDILNFGWGLFRWINVYVFNPIFIALASTGMNYGLVILFLTLIIKLVLMPIQWKMYVSSAKMRILKPEIDELNAKYPNKEDAMKKQTEMMTLDRESGASPFSGCLPMLIQMPILFAVFRYFPAAFDLRQQSFLWAHDLSTYDSIYTFGTYIPLYGDHISLFTLLMSVTTLVYTHYNSGNMTQPQQPGMPNMKVIMYIFPITMIFFFNNYSAGLSYYYFISTLISILMMVAIKQFFVDEDKLKAKMEAKKAEAVKGGKKKSKFQERLEAMQKMQAEQQKMRNKK
ncbi:MAG TPA: membrane protein insertase YidC [Crocinitomicaceae bacterium]|nr:membrane protein insertase YidC [Crocinitomicaceae bacterium]